MSIRKHPRLSLAPAVLALLSPSLMAQPAGQPAVSQIDEILVTAQRRQERAQNVPISIASMNSELLREANVQKLADVGKLTPGLRFDYNANFVQPTIRGIGTAAVTSGGTANVGIYVDGFYSANPLAADMELVNIQAVDVLKGPQGTLFGRNTTGGAIQITTTDPSHEARATLEAGYGRFDTWHVKGYGTAGLGETVAADFSASYRSSDGPVKNITPGGPSDPAQYENWSIRTGVKWDVSDRASLLLRYTRHDIDDGSNVTYSIIEQDGMAWHAGTGAEFWPFPAEGIATDFREAALSGDWPRPSFQMESDILQLTGTYQFDGAILTSYTQYREDDTSTIYDLDGTANPVVYAKFFIKDKTFSQEFILVSDSDSRLQWTTGLFYFDYRNTFDPIDYSAFGAPFAKVSGSSATTETLAGFVDLTYELTDALFLTVGGRYSRDRFKDSWVDIVDASGITRIHPSDTTDNTFTPRVVLRYQMDNASIYASYTQGYKAPILDLVRPGGPGEVDQEEVDAWEIGYKYASGALAYNVAAWYYDYTDLQVSSYPEGLSRVSNAASAEIYGIEGDVRYHFTPNFDINIGAAWMKAEYDSFEDASRFAPCTDPVLCGDGYGLLLPYTFDASGQKMQRAPEFTAHLGARYGLDVAEGRLTLSGSVYHTSRIYFDQAAQFSDDGYTLLGLRAEWLSPSGRYSIAIHGDNVTNQKYSQQMTVNNFGAVTTWGMPATWGISARLEL